MGGGPPPGRAELTILVIEHVMAEAAALVAALGSNGYCASAAATGRDALDMAAAQTPDLFLLDLELSDMAGIDVCRRLRGWTRNPIVAVSADGAEERKIATLDAGADDYVTKPVSMGELLARLRVAERHRHLTALIADDRLMVAGDVVIDPGAMLVRIAGRPTDFTRRELQLLTVLMRNTGKVVTHACLLNHVWDCGGNADTLRVHVRNVRRKLGTGQDRPRIVTARGSGYCLVTGELP